ncbi:unnamed protein product [Euphydryas editha]|uniref:Reverse transcriptase domain-containing protein n=1 Tax=Euphydryas editha TaxID=104508 RepID=A0AAU9UQJ6_EUPED|nr:unnamed protein product [Euphydryas editha]
METLQEYGLRIINQIDEKFCTRETNSTKTIIDHVCSNLKENQFHMALIESPLSDHKQIYLELQRHHPDCLSRVKYEVVSYNKLNEVMSIIEENHENSDFSQLEERLVSNINKSKIIKTKILNPPRQDWIDGTIIDQINNRNILWKAHKISPNDVIKETTFKKARNEVTLSIRKKKAKYYCKMFGDCRTNPAKMWSLLNNLCVNKVKEKSVPEKLQTSNGYITNKKEICECFNNYFSTIGLTLANNINKTNHNNSLFITSASSSVPYSLSNLTPATTDEILSIINNLKTNTSSGLDGISSKTIKCIKHHIQYELTECINKCLEQGTFPDSLKIAKVTPIYKSGSRYDPGNYRPISVLPVLSKIFERVLYTRLEKYLSLQKFLYKKQYGFRSKSNTLSATMDLVTRIKLSIDNKEIVLGIFIDLKKAFDTVSHDIMLRKLNDIGITGRALEIFKSYLANRYQIVKIGSHQSGPGLITCGIPQGSILGPLLFLIYVNNMADLSLKGDITLYADDTCLFYFGNSIESIMADAQKDLDLLNTWLQSNLLTINISKTKYIIFAAKNKKIRNFVPPVINKQPISKVDNEKYLGLILDSKMSWKPHIQKIKTKLRSLTGLLRGTVGCYPRHVRYTIYNSLVKPHIDYLIQLWGTAAKTNLKELQIAQNKLIKILFNYDFFTSTKKMYKETQLLNIEQTYTYYTCLLIRKILNKDIHTQITFTKKQQIHNMRLRNANDLNLYTARTNYGKKSIMYEGARIYNTLPKDIKIAKSMPTFKKLLKHYIITKFNNQ